MKHSHPHHDREVGNALLAMLLVTVVTIAIAGALLSTAQVNARHGIDVETNLRAVYLADAAVNMAFAEVAADDDVAGDGLGALGINTPVPFFDPAGNQAGEVRTFVQIVDDRNVITALSAIPSFANPQTLSAVQAVIIGERPFLLAPRPGAVAIAGPLQRPEFQRLGDHAVFIDGGDQPAFHFTEAAAHAKAMDQVGDAIASGRISGTEFQGGETTTFTHASAGEITLPFVNGEEAFLDSAALNDYRNTLRAAAESIATNADRVITNSVTGNRVWGTAANPEVTVIEAGMIGSDRVFDQSGQTVTGHGTLIIKHTCNPLRHLNFEWTGNIFIIGYDGDGDDLFRPYGLDATINGNMILLSDDGTEASFEPEGGSQITVNGALLTLAESASHESEVEMLGNSDLVVNGLLGMFGSRIELEISDSDSSLTINGSLAIGTATDVNRSDDFEFQMDGDVSIVYDRDLVDTAVDGLAGLPVNRSSSGSFAPDFENFRIAGIATGLTGRQAFEQYQQLVSGGGSDFGVDFEATIPAETNP
ncbi:MAG: hypothetical protein AAF581_09055 [Planctomycetota bacterium]